MMACRRALVLAALVLASSLCDAEGSAPGDDSFVIDTSSPLVASTELLTTSAEGWANAAEFTALSALAEGLLGLWRFDSLTAPALSSTDGAVVNRGSSLAAVGSTNAVISGNTSANPLAPGKFGNGLNVIGNRGNWAQLFPSPWGQNAPSSGFSVALWYQPKSETGNSGALVERTFTNLVVGTKNALVNCQVRGPGGVIKTITASATFKAGTWSHVACTYTPSGSGLLALYVNGTLSTSTVYAIPEGKFQHDNSQPLGIGNRPGSITNLAAYATDNVNAVIDELAAWGRTLTANEVSALFTSDIPMAVVPPMGLTTVKVVRPAVAEFSAMSVSWTLSPLSPATTVSPTAVRVLASTDNGRSWCEVANGAVLTDTLHGGSQTVCLFPAAYLTLKAVWRANAVLSPLQVSLTRTAPSTPPMPVLPLGLNLEGVTYYSAAWSFKDVMQGSLGNSWPTTIRSGTDANGYPLAIVPSLDNPAGSSFWVTGRAMYWTRQAGLGGGAYTLYAQGTGKIVLSSGWTPSTLTLPLPGGKATLTSANTNDLSLLVSESKLGDHVRNVSVFIPGHDRDTQAASGSRFHPLFVQRMGAAKLLRFMDWGDTNSNLIAKWSQRSTPDYISQAAAFRLNASIASTECFNPISPNAFINEAGSVKITTTTPHGLVTGQQVSISGNSGSQTTSRGRVVSVNGSDRMVEVLDDYTFAITLRNWQWASDETVTSCVAGSGGAVTFKSGQGVAYEYMAELANQKGADAWVCVPPLADDDYVRNMAQLLAARLSPSRKLYVEYSNEVWNWMFDVADYATRKARQVLGPVDGNDRLRWNGYRSKQIFDIFSQHLDASRLVRVIAAQSGGGRVELEAAGGVAGSPTRVADVLAIAPYFKAEQGEVYNQAMANGGTYDIDLILDRCRSDIQDGVRSRTRASKAVANQFGLRLVAYEGGQHLGGGGATCGSTSCENVQPLVDALAAANRNARMRGLYDNYFRMWKEEGGEEFAVFSFTGKFTKWGSWGLLESMDQDASTAPKYQAVMAYMDNAAATQAA